jgi:DNA-directed RNA polymerase specialized sigma24 family protein
MINTVRTGSQAAAWDLIEQYSSQILRIVRRRLPRQLRGQFDQQFIQLRYAGVAFREIAERLGFDEGTVRRAIRKIFQEQVR